MSDRGFAMDVGEVFAYIALAIFAIAGIVLFVKLYLRKRERVQWAKERARVRQREEAKRQAVEAEDDLIHRSLQGLQLVAIQTLSSPRQVGDSVLPLPMGTPPSPRRPMGAPPPVPSQVRRSSSAMVRVASLADLLKPPALQKHEKGASWGGERVSTRKRAGTEAGKIVPRVLRPSESPHTLARSMSLVLIPALDVRPEVKARRAAAVKSKLATRERSGVENKVDGIQRSASIASLISDLVRNQSIVSLAESESSSSSIDPFEPPVIPIHDADDLV